MTEFLLMLTQSSDTKIHQKEVIYISDANVIHKDEKRKNELCNIFTNVLKESKNQI